MTGETRKQLFFSLKWKAFIFTSSLLTLIFGVFIAGTYYYLEDRFVEQLAQTSRRLVEQSEATVENKAEQLEQLASLFTQLDGVKDSLRVSSSKSLTEVFDEHLFQLELEAGIRYVAAFAANDDLLLWHGNPQIPPDLIKDYKQTGTPIWTVTCYEGCDIYLAAPLPMPDGSDGMLILGAVLTDMIRDFEAVSGADVAIAIRRSEVDTEDVNYLKQWESELVAVSNSGKNKAMLNYAASLFERRDVFQGEQLEYSGRYYYLVLRPLKGAVFPRQGELIFMQDITHSVRDLSAAKKNGLVFIIVGLVFSELILLATLWGPLHRLRIIAAELPLLATTEFSEIRKKLVKLERLTVMEDESDILNKSAIHLSHLLEDFQSELQQRALQLESQTVDLESEKQFVTGLLDTAHAVIFTQDRNGVLSLVNPYAAWITGYGKDELVGKRFLALLPEVELLPDLRFQLNELARGGRQALNHESAVCRKDGSTIHMAWYHSALPDAKNEHYILTVGLDISERKEAEERLGWLASHDPLTRLFNRRRFAEELEKTVAHSKRYRVLGAVLFFDLDQFKDVNDSSGHQVGDEMLIRVADRLQEHARDSDMIFRLGGDEFAMIIRQVNEDTAGKTAERLCRALRSIEVQGAGRVHRVSSSIGVALFPSHGEFVDELLANADIAMYKAKEAGRNGWHIFQSTEADKARIHERVYWNEKVKEALSEDQLLVAFQPIQDVTLGTISHYEALLRVFDEQGNPLPTGKFVLYAEKSGLVHDVDLCIVEKSLRHKKELQDRGVNATIAINLSGASFRNPALYERILGLIEKYEICTEEVIFEITETAAVEDISDTATKMKDLKRLGCKFALDDFGVGFSSLYHLKQLPLDFVKIDGSFIKHLPDQPEDQALVKAVVEVAKVFGLKTVAEFVEDGSILAVLSELGVDYAQGYFIDKPKLWDDLWGSEKNCHEAKA